MTTTTTSDVPLPAGADYVDSWQGESSEMPYRFIGSRAHCFANDVAVWVSATQFADGSIDDGRIEAPGVFVSDRRFPNDTVREMISVLQESLALVEQWSGTGTVSGQSDTSGHDVGTHPVDSATRPCCQGIGRHTPVCTDIPDLPIPAGALRADWQDLGHPGAFRLFAGSRRVIPGDDTKAGIGNDALVAYVGGTQELDGTVERHIVVGPVHPEQPITPQQAIDFGRALIELGAEAQTLASYDSEIEKALGAARLVDESPY